MTEPFAEGEAPPPPEEGEEPEGEDGPPKGKVFEIPELHRLRALIDQICEATSVVPKDCMTLNADNKIVANKMFNGLDYPAKLESFLHKLSGPGGRYLRFKCSILIANLFLFDLNEVHSIAL